MKLGINTDSKGTIIVAMIIANSIDFPGNFNRAKTYPANIEFKQTAIVIIPATRKELKKYLPKGAN